MIRYRLFNPTGNITALVENTVAPERYAAVAKKILADCPRAEQVGFVAENDGDAEVRLDMAGGEFCGNASMCAALWYALRHPDFSCVRVKCSGNDEILTVALTPEENGDFAAALDIPGVNIPVTRLLSLNGRDQSLSVVRMPGITHIIYPCEIKGDAVPLNAAELMPGWCDKLNTPCLGLMFLDESALCLRPYVYVREVQSLFRETSCASGTAAAGRYLAWLRQKAVNIPLREPGGILRVQASPTTPPRLTGRVRPEEEHSLCL